MQLSLILALLCLVAVPAQADELVLRIPARHKVALRAAWELRDLSTAYDWHQAVVSGRTICLGCSDYATGEPIAGLTVGLTGSGAAWEIPAEILAALPLWKAKDGTIMWGAKPLNLLMVGNWIGQLYKVQPDGTRRAVLDCQPPLVQPVVVEVE